MDVGLIGLGRMGGNMARRLRQHGIGVVGYDRHPAVVHALAAEAGVKPVPSIEQLVGALAPPRSVWLMLPAGDTTERELERLAALLTRGDILIDGGNSYYKDSMRRGAALAQRGIHFVDAGVSGGVWGLQNGYTLMLGGEALAIERLQPVIRALAPDPNRGWLHCGPVGAGHFVKMIHNGIEYGMMQAYAEGLALLKHRADFNFDLAAITETWRHGSVIRSWLLDLTAEFLAHDPELKDIEPYVGDSGEGRWTAVESIEQGVPAPVMNLAVMMRFASQGKFDYAARLLALMRKGFGGHAPKPKA